MNVDLGILGGVFDPPHVGHVALARSAIERLGLSRLLVLVVADPGHKAAVTPADVRLELARAAFRDVPEAEVELDEHARTVDSLRERSLGEAVFVVGADEFAAFLTWKEPERILELVRLGVATRPGVPSARLEEQASRLARPDRVTFFEMEGYDVSSSEVRERLAAGEPVDELVPRPVAALIARRGLYAGGE